MHIVCQTSPVGHLTEDLVDTVVVGKITTVQEDEVVAMEVVVLTGTGATTRDRVVITHKAMGAMEKVIDLPTMEVSSL